MSQCNRFHLYQLNNLPLTFKKLLFAFAWFITMFKQIRKSKVVIKLNVFQQLTNHQHFTSTQLTLFCLKTARSNPLKVWRKVIVVKSKRFACSKFLDVQAGACLAASVVPD